MEDKWFFKYGTWVGKYFFCWNAFFQIEVMKWKY